MPINNIGTNTIVNANSNDVSCVIILNKSLDC